MAVTALGCAAAAVWSLGPVAALVCMVITVSFVFTFNYVWAAVLAAWCGRHGFGFHFLLSGSIKAIYFLASLLPLLALAVSSLRFEFLYSSVSPVR